MYTNEQYKKDLQLIEKLDKLKTVKLQFVAHFFAFSACLAAHTLYLVLFAMAGVKSMMIFNIFSVLFYILEIISVKWIKEKLILVYATLLEIIIHAAFATVCVGCESDFVMFLLMIIPIAFLIPQKNKTIPFAIMLSSVILYGALRYQFMQPGAALYDIEGTYFVNVFYIINIAAGAFVLIYVTTIYSYMQYYTECKLRVQNEKLRMLASTDPLTKLYNRREMGKKLTAVCDESIKSGKKYVVGIGDVDDFKKVNDTYGHDFGDTVLSAVAEVIAENIPSTGYVARWGGEEFLFIIPESGIEVGRQTAETIIALVDGKTFTSGDRSFSVTVTIGICEGFPKDNIDKVISHADSRLYKGKHNGKNRVEYTD
ncbi:MAG: GGDEF domain-containing protein [Ruminococcus sp.]|nr:GGDEF domain-containing protein [Ruminococcus sp.]